MKSLCKYLLSTAALCALPLSTVAQQNIVDDVLSPTSTAPAFGTVIDYTDTGFLIDGWTTSDYDDYPQISDLPTMYLTTDEGETLDYSNKTETYYSATIVIVDKHGKMKQRNEAVTFRGRGNATWNSGSYKKPWRLKFPSKTSLLAEWDLSKGEEVENYADAKSWTLLSNPFDKSMMRNALTYELGKLIGLPFCPAYRFVDLVLNGEYYGTYQVSDHVQVDKKRVYVNSKNDWFMELCDGSYAEDPDFSTNGCHFNIKNPDDDTEAAAAMQAYMSKVVTAVNNKTGLSDYVDLASLADYLMGMDVTANYDGVKGNGYCYKGLEDTDKLKWGPLWDIDLGYGNVGGWASASNVDAKHFWEINSGYNAWFFKAIYETPEFQKVFYPRWKAVYEAGLAKNLNLKVDDIYNGVKTSAVLNYTKGGHVVYQSQWYTNAEYWSMGVSNMGLTYTDSHDPAVVASDYAKAYNEIKDFITTHVEWLNTQYIKDYESITGLSASDAEDTSDDEDENTSDDNTSDDNTGDENTGDNTGDDNTGDNTGDDNTSDNTGDDNTGDNTSDDNTGDNTSDDNTGDNTVDDAGDQTIGLLSTYTATLSEWRDIQIPASAFDASSTSADITITGACYACFKHGSNKQNVSGGEFYWSSSNQNGITLSIDGDLLTEAMAGSLYVFVGGGSPINLKVESYGYTTGSDEEDDNTSDDNTGEDNTSDDNTSEDNTGDDNTSEDNTGDDVSDDTTTTGDGYVTKVYNATFSNGYFHIPASDLATNSESIKIEITDGDLNYIWVKYTVNGGTQQWNSGVYYSINYEWGKNYGDFTIDDASQISSALVNGINILSGFSTATITVTCYSSALQAPGRNINGLENISDETPKTRIFDLNGHLYESDSELPAGTYIINGKKVMIK
jgi:hypothetical protein